MSLRAKKPEAIQKRLKAFFYGNAKVGKTTAAIQFPKCYLIDTERGAENDKYVELLDKNGGVIFQTNDFEEVMREVKTLLTIKHEYKTLVIDPFTTIYNDLVEKAEKKGTDYGRHYNEANKYVKSLYNLLLRLDMNVIITSHAKTVYGAGMTVIGQTFDSYKKMDYLFDLILEIQKRGKERVALIKGSRLEGFKEDEIFPFSYEDVANRYGKEILEKDAVPTALANEEDVKEIKRLIDLLHVPEEYIQKLFKREEVESFEYMSADYIKKCINTFTQKIQGNAA